MTDGSSELSGDTEALVIELSWGRHQATILPQLQSHTGQLLKRRYWLLLGLQVCLPAC
jgi:hypothetical protein